MIWQNNLTRQSRSPYAYFFCFKIGIEYFKKMWQHKYRNNKLRKGDEQQWTIGKNY